MSTIHLYSFFCVCLVEKLNVLKYALFLKGSCRLNTIKIIA